jgi:hypothetical protein
MGGWLALMIVVSACNQVFDIKSTDLAEPPVVDALEIKLVYPPATTPPCEAPPDFESWTYAPHPIAIGSAPLSIAPFESAGTARAMLSPINEDAVFDVAVDGSEIVRLTPLDGGDQIAISSPSVVPDGSVVWFSIFGNAGVYYASRDEGWSRHPADVGFVDAYQTEPSSVGFRDGTVRMMLLVIATGTQSFTEFVELSSSNGTEWTALETVKFPAPLYAYDPFLSADGCLLFWQSNNKSYYAARDADGEFTTPVPLTKANALDQYVYSPALAPDRQALWVVTRTSGTPAKLYRGTP